MKTKSVTIVIPVYGDWPSLKDCIESLQKYVDTSKHKIMLVNDCGPDAEEIEQNIRAAIRDCPGFIYFRNPKNLGFIGNCNRAVMELDTTDNNILLLNSDTVVTEGFLEEMMYVLEASPKHGAVSPRSNNASIMTVPLSTATQKGIGKKQSYDVYKKIRPHLPRFQEVPVAHGFCMLIRRSLVIKYGLFDTVFGKGYGEEVDFCQRIAKHGYKSIVANHAYVFHMEAKSFSLETKAQLLEQNNKIIWERYPHYRQSVRDYMEKAIPQEILLEKQAGVRRYATPRQRLIKIAKRSRLITRAYNSVNKK